MKSILAATLLVVAVCGPSQAHDVFGVSEVRGGIFAHSVDQGGPNGALLDFRRIQDANIELVFKPWLDFQAFGTISPNIGATINFGGLESMVYAGAVWHLPVPMTPFFAEAGLGGSVNNGAHTGAVWPARDLGCSVLFHEQLSVGMDVTPNADVMLTAEHASSANLCLPNQGLTNMGVRVGFKF